MKKAIFAVLLLASFGFVSAEVNPPDLMMGSQSDEVGSLQTFLGMEPTTWFGAMTESKVKDFQKSKGLPITGVVSCEERALIRSLAPCTVAKSASTGGGGAAKLSANDSWYQQNCLPEPVGLEYGRITPIFYTPSGMGGTELAQINKPFNVSATGLSSTTNSARITASDNQVTITPASCTNGTNIGNMGCTVTVSGEPRDIYLRIFNGRTGIKPVCHKVTLYRAPITYTLGLSVDKDQFASNESFEVTISGMTRAQLEAAYGNGQGYVNAPFRFTRSGAPSSSCEYALTMGVCQADSIMNCGILPGDANSAPKFLCAATGLDTSSSLRYPNKNGPVTYTLTIVRSNGLFDNYVPAATGYSDSIVLKKQGEQGGGTSYGNCPSGEGIDPRYPGNGCTRCQNIPNLYRSQIPTCGTTNPDSFVWRGESVSDSDLQWYQGAQPCSSFSNFGEGRACPGSGYFCIDAAAKKKYDCVNLTSSGGAYHGKVLDENNQPLSGVTVQAWSVIGNMMSYASPCPSATTTASGDYNFSQAQSGSICFSNGYVRFKKAGYVEESIPVGNEFDKLIRTYTMKKVGGAGPVNPGTPVTPGNPNALLLSPANARLAHQAGASVKFVLKNGALALGTNAASRKLDVCYETTRRAKDQFTPNEINKPANPSSCAWVERWEGNSDWKRVGDDLEWTLNYTAASFDICKGVQIVVAFRHRDTGQVTYSVLEAEGRPANDACHGSGASGNTSGYYWHESAGVFSPAPPSCSSMGLSPNHGSPCTQPNVGCQSGGNEFRCSQGVPAPKSAVVAPPATPAEAVVAVVTNTATAAVNAVNTAIVEPVIEIVNVVVGTVSNVGGLLKKVLNIAEF